jgi:hypothetical protein
MSVASLFDSKFLNFCRASRINLLNGAGRRRKPGFRMDAKASAAVRSSASAIL